MTIATHLNNARCQACGRAWFDPTNAAPCPGCGSGDIVEIATEKKAVPTKASPHKPSAMFRRASIERSRTGVERLTAWIVLLVSVLGTIVAFHGGWEAFTTARRLPAVLAGITIQSGLTYVQWAYYHRRALSLGSRLIDTGLTVLGFGPLFAGALTRFFFSIGITSVIAGQPGAVIVTWATLIIASYGLAWYPESRLVD